MCSQKILLDSKVDWSSISVELTNFASEEVIFSTTSVEETSEMDIVSLVSAADVSFVSEDSTVSVADVSFVSAVSLVSVAAVSFVSEVSRNFGRRDIGKWI